VLPEDLGGSLLQFFGGGDGVEPFRIASAACP
jgi:hypothetical protein